MYELLEGLGCLMLLFATGILLLDVIQDSGRCDRHPITGRQTKLSRGNREEEIRTLFYGTAAPVGGQSRELLDFDSRVRYRRCSAVSPDQSRLATRPQDQRVD